VQQCACVCASVVCVCVLLCMPRVAALLSLLAAWPLVAVICSFFLYTHIHIYINYRFL
jgi:hypothetical protein